MKKRIFQILSLLLVMALFSACGSTGSPSKRPQLHTDFSQKENTFSFEAVSSEKLHISQKSAAAVLDVISQIQPEYEWEALYQLEEVNSRLDFDASVENHRFSALNTAGKLDAAHLASLVKENNDAFLATKPFGYQSVEDDYIADLCDFIVRIVQIMAEKYPDVDWPRVYCNLGDL